MSEHANEHAEPQGHNEIVDLETAIRRRVLKQDERYGLAAYLFVYEALAHTQKLLGKDDKDLPSEQRHVTGRELLEGIRDLAAEQFGPLAPTVFRNWGLRASSDFGDLVFNLVNHGLLGKTDQDNRGDFDGGFDMDAVFDGPFKAKPR